MAAVGLRSLLVVAIFLTFSSTLPASDNDNDDAVEKALTEKKVALNMTVQPLEHAIAKLLDGAEIPWHADDTVREELVSRETQELFIPIPVTYKTALILMLDPHGFSFIISEGRVEVVPQSQLDDR